MGITWLLQFRLARMSDAKAQQEVEKSFDALATSRHSWKDLYEGEKLAVLSTELLEEILMYNDRVGNNMGPNLRNELRAYIALRKRPKEYLLWAARNRERQHFGFTGLSVSRRPF